MDEKGCFLGLLQSAKVITRQGTPGFQAQDGNRETITIIECICADGTALRPYYIFKGQRCQVSWIQDDPLHANYSVSPNGWTDCEICRKWGEAFWEQIKHKPGKHLLILDGHNSHVSIEFVKFCKEHGIELACFPSHATGFLQPLDVGIFGPLSHAWSKVLTNEMTGGVHIRKQDFTR